MALEIGQGYSLDVDEININDADLIIGGDKKIGFGGGVTEAIYKTGGGILQIESGGTTHIEVGGDLTTSSSGLKFNTGGSFYSNLTTDSPTADRTYTLPDASGTIALVGSISNEYIALLTQIGTSAPTESVLSDTLTGGTWSYSSVGHYHYTKVGAFTNANKVEVRIEASQFLFMSMTNNAYNMMSAARLDNDTILVKTTNVGYVGLTGKGLTDPNLGGTITDFFVDDILSNTPITIRVWS